MADHHISNAGWIPATITILLGIISKITVSDVAAFISIAVGLYTLYINFPRFKDRFAESCERVKAWYNRTFNR